jgi:hypothetical protein
MIGKMTYCKTPNKSIINPGAAVEAHLKLPVRNMCLYASHGTVSHVKKATQRYEAHTLVCEKSNLPNNPF